MMVETGLTASRAKAGARLRRSWSVTMPIRLAAGPVTRMALLLARAMVATRLWISMSGPQVTNVSGMDLMERMASGSMLCRSATRRRHALLGLFAGRRIPDRGSWPRPIPIRTGPTVEEDIGHLAVLVEDLARRSVAGSVGLPVGERGDDLLQRQLGQFLFHVPQAVPQGCVRVDGALLHHQQDALGGALHQQPMLLSDRATPFPRATKQALEVQPLLGDVGQEPGDDDRIPTDTCRARRSIALISARTSAMSIAHPPPARARSL